MKHNLPHPTSAIKKEDDYLQDFDDNHANNVNKTEESNEEIDWETFRFPEKPAKKKSESQNSRAPYWAAPPIEIYSWHLDMERLLIIHPVLRKKIDLSRINSKRRLVQLAKLIKEQNEDHDIACLWKALDTACKISFDCSLPEFLASPTQSWEWNIE